MDSICYRITPNKTSEIKQNIQISEKIYAEKKKNGKKICALENGIYFKKFQKIVVKLRNILI